ncbi:RNase A-like domain-containing protein [Streptomyces griseus]|uniref:RNase A-like domain-containing protein n=1 Tax=Streptomyces griseus TaxID=1911 RepID=UPI0033A0FB29
MAKIAFTCRDSAVPLAGGRTAADVNTGSTTIRIEVTDTRTERVPVLAPPPRRMPKPTVVRSSCFPNYRRAEELTERNLNKNKAAIEAWIKGPSPASDGDVKSFYDKVPSGETSGRSVSKQQVDPNDPLSGYKQGGLNAKAYDVSGVDTRIRYDSNRNPPFTVMTSMPSKT